MDSCFLVFLAQSWFETEKQSTEVESAVAEDVPEESEQPSVPTGSATELRCHVCHDEFKQFYNEEMEEWHIKPAVVFEDNYFHPLCLEDHKVNRFTYTFCQFCIIISFSYILTFNVFLVAFLRYRKNFLWYVLLHKSIICTLNSFICSLYLL